MDRDLHPPLGNGGAIIPPQPLRPAPQSRPIPRPRPTPFSPPNPIEFLHLNEQTKAPLTPPPAPRLLNGKNRGNKISMFTFQNNHNDNPYNKFNQQINEPTSLKFDTYTTSSIPETIQMSSYIYPSVTSMPNYEKNYENIDSFDNHMKDVYLSKLNRDSPFGNYDNNDIGNIGDVENDDDIEESTKSRYIVPSKIHDNNLNREQFRYISSSYPGYEYTSKNHNQIRQKNKNDIPNTFNITNHTTQCIINNTDIYDKKLSKNKYKKNSNNWDFNNIDWKNKLSDNNIDKLTYKNSSISQEELTYTIPGNFESQGLQRVSQYIQSLPDLPIYDTMDDQIIDDLDDDRKDGSIIYHDYLNHQANGNVDILSGNEHKFNYNSVPSPAPPDPINHSDILGKNGQTTGERIFSALRSVSSQSYIDASEFYKLVQ